MLPPPASHAAGPERWREEREGPDGSDRRGGAPIARPDEVGWRSRRRGRTTGARSRGTGASGRLSG